LILNKIRYSGRLASVRTSGHFLGIVLQFAYSKREVGETQIANSILKCLDSNVPSYRT